MPRGASSAGVGKRRSHISLTVMLARSFVLRFSTVFEEERDCSQSTNIDVCPESPGAMCNRTCNKIPEIR